MVQIIPRAPAKKTFAQKLNAGLGPALETALKYSEENKENEALKARGIDLAGIRDPNTRSQIVAHELQFGKKSRAAEASRDIDYLGTGSRDEREQEFANNFQNERKKMPEFLQKEAGGRNQSLEKNPRSLIPQEETAGGKQQILNPQQLKQRGDEIARQSSQNGIPMSALEGYEIASHFNNENENYNKRIDADIQKRAAAEEAYGNVGVETLKRSLPDATPEQEALFRRKAEEAANNGESQSDVRKNLAIEARKFKNTIANVKSSLGPSRLFSGAKKNILGTSREDSREKMSLRLKLEPLLKEGLYDTARNLLSEVGYHPEERESIITDLPESAIKSMSAFPKMERQKIEAPKNLSDNSLVNLSKDLVQRGVPNERKVEPKQPYSEKQQEQIYDTIGNVLKTDPSTNLILLRSKFGEKGVDWDEFRNQLDWNIANGNIKLNDDQFEHLNILDEPPLDNLDKILYKANLIGK